MDWTNPLVYISAGVILVGAGLWAGRMEYFRTSAERMLTEIRDDIKRIFDRLPSAVISSASPNILTDLGRKVSSEIKAYDWANSQVASEHLTFRVKGKNQYEVQKFAFAYVKECFLPPEFIQAMQTSAYENGISYDEVLDVLGIELRDALNASLADEP
ncbi:MAG: hypothetical protein F4X51_15090 [Gemmatimonadetes bacterium]|nr:hypothetical protein [Gemmatimonadota bacterium]